MHYSPHLRNSEKLTKVYGLFWLHLSQRWLEIDKHLHSHQRVQFQCVRSAAGVPRRVCKQACQS